MIIDLGRELTIFIAMNLLFSCRSLVTELWNLEFYSNQLDWLMIWIRFETGSTFITIQPFSTGSIYIFVTYAKPIMICCSAI